MSVRHSALTQLNSVAVVQTVCGCVALLCWLLHDHAFHGHHSTALHSLALVLLTALLATALFLCTDIKRSVLRLASSCVCFVVAAACVVAVLLWRAALSLDYSTDARTDPAWCEHGCATHNQSVVLPDCGSLQYRASCHANVQACCVCVFAIANALLLFGTTVYSLVVLIKHFTPDYREPTPAPFHNEPVWVTSSRSQCDSTLAQSMTLPGTGNRLNESLQSVYPDRVVSDSELAEGPRTPPKPLPAAPLVMMSTPRNTQPTLIYQFD